MSNGVQLEAETNTVENLPSSEPTETQDMALVFDSDSKLDGIAVPDDAPVTPDPLTDEEAALLVKCKKVIKEHSKGFMAVSEALATIRRKKLYRKTHGTFEKFVRTEFGFTRSYADRLIQAGKVVQKLTPIGIKITNEAQARAVASVPEEIQVEVAELATEMADGEPLTGKLIKEAQEVVSPSSAKKKPAKKEPAPEPEEKIIQLPTTSSDHEEMLAWVRNAMEIIEPHREVNEARAWLTKLEYKLECLVDAERKEAA